MAALTCPGAGQEVEASGWVILCTAVSIDPVGQGQRSGWVRTWGKPEPVSSDTSAGSAAGQAIKSPHTPIPDSDVRSSEKGQLSVLGVTELIGRRVAVRLRRSKWQEGLVRQETVTLGL